MQLLNQVILTTLLLALAVYTAPLPHEDHPPHYPGCWDPEQPKTDGETANAAEEEGRWRPCGGPMRPGGPF